MSGKTHTVHLGKKRPGAAKQMTENYRKLLALVEEDAAPIERYRRERASRAGTND